MEANACARCSKLSHVVFTTSEQSYQNKLYYTFKRFNRDQRNVKVAGLKTEVDPFIQQKSIIGKGSNCERMQKYIQTCDSQQLIKPSNFSQFENLAQHSQLDAILNENDYSSMLGSVKVPKINPDQSIQNIQSFKKAKTEMHNNPISRKIHSVESRNLRKNINQNSNMSLNETFQSR